MIETLGVCVDEAEAVALMVVVSELLKELVGEVVIEVLGVEVWLADCVIVELNDEDWLCVLEKLGVPVTLFVPVALADEDGLGVAHWLTDCDGLRDPVALPEADSLDVCERLGLRLWLREDDCVELGVAVCETVWETLLDSVWLPDDD